MSSTWTSFTAWVKDMHQAWSRHIILVVVVAVAFGMLQKPLLALLSFIESTCLSHLSPNCFGGLVLLLVGYLLKREWDYRKIYVPRPVSLWLILLLGIYLYYRHWEGSFSFWEIPGFGKLPWSDLLLFPWGGAVAIAFRSRLQGERAFLDLIMLGVCVCPYYLLQGQRSPLKAELLTSGFVAVGASLLMYIVLYLLQDCKLPNFQDGMQYEEEEGGLDQVEPIPHLIEIDNPIVTASEDWLGFSDLVNVLCFNLQDLNLDKSSLTVGVIASWGKGKSSFINLLKKQLKMDRGIIVTFNPRGSKSLSSIQEDFFDVFAKELSRYCLGFSLLLARYTKYIGLLNQYERTRPIGSLLTLLLPAKEQEAVNRTLRELGRRVYVMIDDLDRLSPEEILEVLKLIDRNASFSNTVFITAYDKAYVNNVLRKHLDHGLDHCFIDKYISWEIPLPEPDKETLKRLVGVELSRKVKDNYPALYGEIQRGWNKVASIVVESLNSVRDLKRYFNLMIPRYNEVIGCVDCEDYFLLYLLCYKDLAVYVALHSRRILQLDIPTKSYLLAPNFKKDLKQISQWEGTENVLKILFPSKGEEGEGEVSYTSLRGKYGFDIYFRGFEDESRAPYADVVLRIIRCQHTREAHANIEEVIEKEGVDQVINAFLYLVKSSLIAGESRSETIELMAYVAFGNYELEEDSNRLKEELKEVFLRDRYLMYKELEIVQSLAEYQQILERMLSFLIHVQPLWISDWIDELADRFNPFFQRCVYSVDQLAGILLGCQRAYYRDWEPSYNAWGLAQSFVFMWCMDSYPQYVERAVRALISFIQAHSYVCVWMVLSWENDRFPRTTYFSLSIDTPLLDLLEKQGFSLDTWGDLIEDPKCRYILDYVRSASEEDSCRYVKLLPEEKMNLNSIDYIYRAVLAQEERERQQAASEG